MKTYLSSSSEETKKLGEKLAKRTLKSRLGKTAKVFALQGELGSGKTTFIQGFFRGLGLKRAPSPTFIIMRRSAVNNKKYKNVFHIDAYRLRRSKELGILGFKEVLVNPRNIVLIEWAERIKKALPKNNAW
ncbi:MAG: tRNA (adenosine(37)-N6)-threonylcarbamoyltransferase complex ATPase subunit type 1 TsaE, partial [Patescibacteria group bacterium]